MARPENTPSPTGRTEYTPTLLVIVVDAGKTTSVRLAAIDSAGATQQNLASPIRYEGYARHAWSTDDPTLAVQVLRRLLDATTSGNADARIAVHSTASIVSPPSQLASARPHLTDAEAVWPLLERAGAILDAALLGEVVISARTADLLDLPSHLQPRDIGWHRLVDLGLSERLSLIRATPCESRSGRSLDDFDHNLPLVSTTLVGREADVRSVYHLLGQQRLVTLLGPGGVGKSRLALATAAQLLEAYPAGVWYAELAGLRGPDDVPAAAASALPSGRNRAKKNGYGRRLLVMDNCEHLLDGCASTVHDLLAADDTLDVLATSQQPLDVEGEVTWQVRGLPVPPASAAASPSELANFASVRLLVSRVRSHDHDFRLNQSSSGPVVGLCRHLDGIPLALELAAARCRQVGVAHAADELDDRLRVLAGRRDGPERHRGLSASVEWSYDRLDERERVVLRRLSIFRGTFDLDLAAAVVSAAGALDVDDVVDGVGQLVDRSLLSALSSTGTRRLLRLLDTIRLFADERLPDSEREPLHRANRQWWMTTLATDAGSPTTRGTHAAESMPDALLCTIETATADGAEAQLRLTGLAARAWHGTSAASHAMSAGKRVLTADNATSMPELWIDTAVVMVAHYAFVGGRAAVQDLAEQAAELPECGSFARAAVRWIANPDRDAAEELAREARHRGDHYLEALALLSLAEHVAERDPRAAETLLRETTAIREPASGYVRHWADLVLGRLARDTGDLDETIRLGVRLASAPSAHMAFNGMILLTQAGLLTCSTSALEAAVEAAEQPWATARMRSQAGVARTHLAYVTGAAPSRVDPEFGREPMTPGSLWLCACEAVDAGDLDLARDATRPPPGSASFHDTVAHAVQALTGDPDAWFHALTSARELGLRLIVVDSLEAIAALQAAEGRWTECLILAGAAERLRDETNYRWRFPGRREDLTTAAAGATAALGNDSAASAVERGAALAWQDAAAYALRRRGRRGRPRHGWGSLTPTEHRVVALVAEGRTNPEIAATMFITTGTAKTHLDHIFVKLGVHTRAEIAAAYARASQASQS